MTLITGTNNNDFLVGTSLNDTLYGELGSDNLRGGLGSDVLNGGAGFDRADYRDSTAGVIITYDAGTSFNATGTGAGSTADGDSLLSIEAIIDSSFNDTIYGNGADNTFYKFGGADVFHGGAGQDKIDYEVAAEAIAGTGIVISLAENKASFGTFNTANTSSNQGTFFAGNSSPRDLMFDIEDVDGTQNNDWIVGNFVANVINGLGGNDYIYTLSGDDLVYAGAGQDFADGGWGNDVLNGQGGDDRLYGGLDNDTLRGGDGYDVLDGGAGQDRIYGGAGNDIVQGGDDQDQNYLWGGQGADVFAFSDAIGDDRIMDFENGTDHLDFSANTAVTSLADLAIAQVNAHVRIIIGGSDRIYTYNTDVADIDVADFIFT